MTSAELTEWMAYERVYGPILAQDRIDIGFAQLGYLIANLMGKPKRTLRVRDFMPAWYQELTRADDVKSGFEALLKMAEHADN